MKKGYIIEIMHLFYTIILLFFMFTMNLFSQDIQESSIQLTYLNANSYSFVERSNWSKYVNGKYTGLTHREVRAFIKNTGSTSNGQKFSGYFYVLEETLRDMSKASQSIDEIYQASFTVLSNGLLSVTKESGYPSLRNFPSYPDKKVTVGDKWQSEGIRIVNPMQNNQLTALPIFVEYQFIGKETYKGEDVYRIRAKYATRLSKYNRPRIIDPNLSSATGTHDVEIIVKAINGQPMLILDKLDETFFYSDGSSIRYKGSTAIFTDAPVPIQKDMIIERIQKIASVPERQDDTAQATSKPSITPDSTLAKDVKKSQEDEQSKQKNETDSNLNQSNSLLTENTDQGLRISIRDIKFAPDSAEILPLEKSRLDTIASALKEIQNGRFLIEGHTAAVGKPEGEQKLSVERAKKIAEELTKRGLMAEQFIYTGYGGLRPIASNETDTGRAQNRRVEITILE